jgi:thiamine-monophosphate kinase
MNGDQYTPFSQDHTISDLGESKLILKIGQWLGDVAPQSPAGMGDDCAVIELPTGHKQILTTDSLSYGQHFDSKVSARDAGAKLIKRNLSDIAAMGGRPGQALLTLLCGSDLSIAWLEQFMAGIRETCKAYELPLVGGDISELADGQFSSVLSLVGYIQHSPLLRRACQIGDRLYVTGSLGGSIRQKHYAFAPRLREGQWLAASGLCTAMMDLTDGLAKDLRELLPPQCAAQIDLDSIPLSRDATLCAAESGRSAMEHAFCDGEDYELIFTLREDCDYTGFEQQWQQAFPHTALSKIGQICDRVGNAPYLDATTKEALPWQRGFEHLRKS